MGCPVLEGPVQEDNVEVMRYRVKAMKDDVEGWVTPVGNQGTTFLEEKVGGLVMRVVKETILTASFEICSDAGKEQFRKLKDTTRKLKPGEQVEVLQWMKKDDGVNTLAGFLERGLCASSLLCFKALRVFRAGVDKGAVH